MKDYLKIETELLLKIEEAKISVKKVISNSLTLGINKGIVEAQIKKIAHSLYNSILEYGDIYKRMAIETRRSLITNASYWYQQSIKEFRNSNVPILKLIVSDYIMRNLTQEEIDFISQFEHKQFIIGEDEINIVTDIPAKFKQTGQLFGEDQMNITNYRKKVNDALVERTLTSKRLRPNEPAFRFSSRNHAEMAVRYDAFNEQVNSLRQRGMRLVLVSQHINSSERCAPWQNRVYSLDGTSGVTDDSNRLEFVPLLEATGTEGLGLFGYNCRHRLIEYIPNMRMQETYKYNERLAKEQRKVDLQMRNYERAIRKEKEKQILATTTEEKKQAINKSVALQKDYKKYAVANNRVVQEWRCKITTTERKFIKLEGE